MNRRPFHVPVQEQTDSQLLSSERTDDTDGVSAGLRITEDKRNRYETDRKRTGQYPKRESPQNRRRTPAGY